MWLRRNILYYILILAAAAQSTNHACATPPLTNGIKGGKKGRAIELFSFLILASDGHLKSNINGWMVRAGQAPPSEGVMFSRSRLLVTAVDFAWSSLDRR